MVCSTVQFDQRTEFGALHGHGLRNSIAGDAVCSWGVLLEPVSCPPLLDHDFSPDLKKKKQKTERK